MPNYRYNMPEYERRNNRGSYSQSAGVRQCRQEYNAPRAACVVPEKSGEMSCAIGDQYDAVSGMPLAMAYVPWQMWRKIYDVEKGFHRGTIFEELDKPFRGMGGVC